MFRFGVCLLLAVTLAYVTADECSSCPCGQACDETSTCVDGCMVFDKFIKAGETQDVYGNQCRCGTETDEKGRIVSCGRAAWQNPPEGSDPWTKNPNC